MGEGTITREEVVKLATVKKSRLSSTLSLLKFTKKASSTTEDENVIPIKGLIPGMAMHYAKCCHPLPGDKIVSYCQMLCMKKIRQHIFSHLSYRY